MVRNREGERRVGVVVGTVVLALLATASSAAATTWSYEPLPSPPTSPVPQGQAQPSPEPQSVSCSSESSCTLVGEVPDANYPSSAVLPMAEHYDGSTWTVQALSGPPSHSMDQLDLSQLELAGVSCPRSDFCMAVGSAPWNRNPDNFVERWAGSGWQLRLMPSMDNEQLKAISCTSGKFCLAVTGGFRSEEWNGAGWRSVPRPSTFEPAQYGNAAGFTSVSCVSSTSCTAVGEAWNYENHAPVFSPFAEHWNGRAWELERVPYPAGAPFTSSAYLYGVSCTSTNACTAVGEYVSGRRRTAARTLAERWDGRRWAVQATPTPSLGSVTGTCFASNPGSWGSQPYCRGLSSVSCSSTRTCTAVGEFGLTADAPLAEQWNGRRWSLESTPTPVATNDWELASVSCHSRVRCIAVGDYYTPPYGAGGAFAEERN